jgi:hypothetical protein
LSCSRTREIYGIRSLLPTRNFELFETLKECALLCTENKFVNFAQDDGFLCDKGPTIFVVRRDVLKVAACT